MNAPSLTLLVIGGLITVGLLGWLSRRLTRRQSRSPAWHALWLVPLVALVVVTAVLSARQRRIRAEVEQHLVAARDHRAEGDLEEALAELEAAAEVDPGDEEIQEELKKTEEDIAEAEKRRRELELQAGGGGGTGAPPQRAIRKPSKVVIRDYSLKVELFPEDGRLEATAELKLRARRPGIRDFELNLSPRLIVSSLRLDGQPARFARDEDTLTVKRQRDLPHGRLSTLTVLYDGFGPGPAVPGGDRIAQDGSYLRAESGWYPTTHLLEFHTPVTVEITVPKGYTAIASGKLVSQKEAGGKTTVTWRSDIPLGMITVAVGKYVKKAKTWHGVELAAYTYAEHADRAPVYLDTIERILDFYRGEFGDYAYPKFAFVEIPKFPGGYAPASLVLCFDEVIKRQDIDEGFIAHEMAHQWWGNLVAPEGPGAGWLSEAFAQYSSWMYEASQSGPSALKQHLSRAREQYIAAIQRGPEPAIADTDPLSQGAAYGGVIYEKGAYVLHMLRRVLGDVKFRQALTRFAQENRGKHVTIADFRKACEPAYGRDMGWFFEQWLERAGHMDLTYDYVAKRRSGDCLLTVVVQQETEKPYTAPLRLGITAGGRSLREQHVLSGPSSRFEVLLDAEPTAITLDPDLDLLMTTPRRVNIPALRQEGDA